MSRLDRFLTLNVFYPLIRSKIVRKNNGIPILMYHSISDELESGLHPYYQTSTSRNTFATHMRFLSENGYSVLNLDEAVSYLKDDNPPPEKAVVLTFDDGFSDFCSEAFPILRMYGFSCTVFLTTAFVDNQQLRFKGKRCLSWQEVRELHRQGVVFGSHTVTHAQLTTLSLDHVKLELEESKRKIESELQHGVEYFSYPFAFPEENREFVKKLSGFLQSAGYSCGVTTKVGIADEVQDPFFLKRIPINNHDDPRLLEAKLSGAYNWMHSFQKSYKYLKQMLRRRNLPSEI